MLLFNADVFDEIITGTAGTWYSYSQHNAMLGAGNTYAIFATPTNVTGTSPTLTLFFETSIDGRAWFTSVSAITGASMSNGVVLYGSMSSGAGIGSYARLRIVLGGTTPACRLKVSVTGRSA